MARRFVYFQGAAKPSAYPLKILLERYDGGADGYYVGGWNQEPVFVAADDGSVADILLLYGITATGPGSNDWLVGGFRNSGGTLSFVFYDHTGLISETVANVAGAYAMAGHFAAGGNNATDTFYWATNTGGSGTGASTDFVHGFVVPSVFAGRRLRETIDTLRTQVVPSPDLSYAVFVGNNPVTTDFPIGNPWLASSSGTFTRINTDLNAAIPRSDLIGLTLYERNQDFIDAQPWATAGEHTLTITPHTLTTSGTVTTGSTFPVAYQAPDPAAYFSWDASLWVEPSTTP